MPPDFRPRGQGSPSDDGSGATRPPSRTARDRLSDALRDRAQSYRQDASVDLTLMEVLLRMDEPEAAARTLDDHRASLHAMAHDLQTAVADAAVEREAELACDTASLDVVGEGARQVTTMRRRALAATSAAAVALVLLLPSGRLSPRTMLTSHDAETAANEAAAARERLVAARSWARALRSQASQAASGHARRDSASPSRDTTVRRKVLDVLGEQAERQPAPSAAGGEVIDLTTRRRERSPKPAVPSSPRGKDTDDADVIDLQQRIDQSVPTPGEPLTVTIPVSPEETTAGATDAAALTDTEQG